MAMACMHAQWNDGSDIFGGRRANRLELLARIDTQGGARLWSMLRAVLPWRASLDRVAEALWLWTSVLHNRAPSEMTVRRFVAALLA